MTEAFAIDGPVWLLHVESSQRDWLRTPFLGLTFLERRLREARQAGVALVCVVCPPALVPWLPRLRKPERCAPWVVVASAAAVPRSVVAELRPLFALLDGGRVLRKLGPPSEWPRAAAWYVERIRRSPALGWVARTLNKRVSLPVSRRLTATRVTPNAVTLVNLLAALGAAWLVALPSPWAVAAGGVLFQWVSIADGVDGELAKLRVEHSAFGAWFDFVADFLALAAFVAGCAVHAARAGAPVAVVGGALIVAVGAAALALGAAARLVNRRFGAGTVRFYATRFVDRLPRRDPVVRVARALGGVVRKDFYSLAFCAACLLGRPEGVLAALAAGGVAAVGFVAYLNGRYGAAELGAGNSDPSSARR